MQETSPMRAIGYREPQDISAETSLIPLDLPEERF